MSAKLSTARPLKVIPQNLIMSDSVNFGQMWTYHHEHPMEVMLDPEYFKTYKPFRTGDTMRIVQVRDGEVLAMAEVLINKADPLTFWMMREPVQIKQINKEMRIVQGKNCWELYEGEGLIDKFPNKKAAEEALAYFEEEAKKDTA